MKVSHIYQRLSRGKGDAIMCRPAIIENMKLRPECNHIVHFDNDTILCLSDIQGLQLLPFIKNDENPNSALDSFHPVYVHNLSNPCINYEMDCINRNKSIELSRQEIFCNSVGVGFFADYNVRFTDEEETFADNFLYRLSNPIGLHTKSISKFRSYPYCKSLYRDLVKFGNSVILFDPFDEIKNFPYKKFIGEDYRKMWAVISKLHFFVGVDSFPIHCAGSTGVNLYGIFGSTDPDMRLKYNSYCFHNKKFRCKRGFCWYVPCRLMFCMNALSPKTIYKDISKTGLIINRKRPSNKKDFIVIRIRGIGDIILTLPAVAGLKDDTGKKITYITGNAGSDILRNASYIDTVISVNYNHNSKGGVDPPILPEINYRNYNSINLINAVENLKEGDSVPRYLLFSKLLGNHLSYQWRFPLPLDWGIETLKNYHLMIDDIVFPYIVFQLHSNGLSRMYPESLQNELFSLFKDYLCVLVDDKLRITQENVINLTGKTSFKEYVGLINRCSLFVGVDSSGTHLAGLLNRSAIGLYGSVNPNLRIGHYERFSVLFGKSKCSGCNDWNKRSCRENEYLNCMYSIRPEQIYNTAKKILEKGYENTTSASSF